VRLVCPLSPPTPLISSLFTASSNLNEGTAASSSWDHSTSATRISSLSKSLHSLVSLATPIKPTLRFFPFFRWLCILPVLCHQHALCGLSKLLQHRPTLTLGEIAPPFAFAFSVVGAGYFESSSGFHKELSQITCDFAAEHLAKIVVHEDERMPRVQTLLLYQLMELIQTATKASSFPFSLGIMHTDSFRQSPENNLTCHHHSQRIKLLFNVVPPVALIPHDLYLPSQNLSHI
jgi:hypothetical protein